MSDTNDLQEIRQLLRDEYREQYGEDMPTRPTRPVEQPRESPLDLASLAPYIPVLILVIALGVFFLAPRPDGLGKVEADLTEAQSRLDQTAKEAASLREEVGSLRGSVERSNPAAVVALEKALQQAEKDLVSLSEQLEKNKRAQEATASALRNARAELAEAKSTFADLKMAWTDARAQVSLVEGLVDFPVDQDARDIVVSFPKYRTAVKLSWDAKETHWFHEGKATHPSKMKGRYEVLFTLRGGKVVRVDVGPTLEKKE